MSVRLVLKRFESWSDEWKTRHRSELQEYRHTLQLLFQNPLSLLGIIIILGLIMVAILAPVLAPYPGDVITSHMDQVLQPPSRAHILGTDEMGRDILSRIIYGARISLQISVVVITIGLIIGIPLGGLAGYFGGWVDEVIMRITDLFLAFPSFLLAMAIAGALGPSLTNAMIAVSITWWPWYTRIVRSQALTIRERPFVEAAKAMGVSHKRIIRQHILPHCIGPVLIQVSMDFGYVILTAAALGFVGLGAQPPQPEWGLMVSFGRAYMPQWWWVATFPGLIIMLVVLGFNFIGDAFRDIMDPRFRR